MSLEIIAEVAQGYEGNPKLAELLARGAIHSGADAIKYQLVFADELCIKAYPYYDFFKSLEMDVKVWEEIVSMIAQGAKRVYFDIYGDISFALAKKLGASGVKISTTDFYNSPLIKKAVDTFERVFISIGGVEVNELDQLIASLKGKKNVILMYGFQAEPTPIEENNLSRLKKLQARYPDLPFGFMDHSLGVSEEAFYLPLMAASLGARVIEKHLTLDPKLKIEDYISGLEPERFAKFVQIMRTMEKALGSSDLLLIEAEKEYKSKAGKIVVAKETLKPGDVLTEENLTLKRVSLDGCPECFRKISDVAGKTIKEGLEANRPLMKENV